MPAGYKRSNTRLMFWLGFGIVASMFFIAIFAPFLAPFDPTQPHPDFIFNAPSGSFWLGTDGYGRDVLSRLIYGARISLWIGFVAVSISLVIGLAFGLVSGYLGGIIDEAIMRFVDVMLCFPSFFLILAVIAFLEASLVNIMVVIGLTSWMGIARLARAETLSLKERDFIAAAKLAGAKTPRIILRHLLPNAMAPVLVAATLGIAGAILVESSLSFLGLGAQPPIASWGNMLLEGKQSLESAWWLSLFPGLAILVTVLGYNILGDSLREMMDPKQDQGKI